jgi:hypothetical protein
MRHSSYSSGQHWSSLLCLYCKVGFMRCQSTGSDQAAKGGAACLQKAVMLPSWHLCRVLWLPTLAASLFSTHIPPFARVVVCNCAFEGDLFGVKARHSLAWAQWQPANKQRQLWRMLVSARLKAFVSTVAPIQSLTACTSTSSRQEFDGQTADHDHVTHICAP